MKKKRSVTIGSVLIFLLLVCSARISNARLRPSSLEDLISDSEVIMFTYPREIHAGFGGKVYYAIMGRGTVLKGAMHEENFKIEFADGFGLDDQRIRNLDERLFFLKKNEDGTYKGTHYGRSYWPLKRSANFKDDGCYAWTLYTYPITLVRIDTKFIQEIEFNISELPIEILPVKTKAICMDDIKKMIEGDISEAK